MRSEPEKEKLIMSMRIHYLYIYIYYVLFWIVVNEPLLMPLGIRVYTDYEINAANIVCL